MNCTIWSHFPPPAPHGAPASWRGPPRWRTCQRRCDRRWPPKHYPYGYYSGLKSSNMWRGQIKHWFFFEKNIRFCLFRLSRFEADPLQRLLFFLGFAASGSPVPEGDPGEPDRPGGWPPPGRDEGARGRVILLLLLLRLQPLVATDPGVKKVSFVVS